MGLEEKPVAGRQEKKSGFAHKAHGDMFHIQKRSSATLHQQIACIFSRPVSLEFVLQEYRLWPGSVCAKKGFQTAKRYMVVFDLSKAEEEVLDAETREVVNGLKFSQYGKHSMLCKLASFWMSQGHRRFHFIVVLYEGELYAIGAGLA